MILDSAKDAPILEFDTDDSSVSKKDFFSNGKKEFWRFERTQKLGITKCILFFPRSFYNLPEIVKDCKLIYEFKSASTISPIFVYKDSVYVALCPLGGPAVANLIEELSFVGVKTFVAMGTCGCLDARFDNKMLIIPSSAIRDEGISYHYLPASRDVQTSDVVNRAVEKILTMRKLPYVFAKVWTTDAIYRETPSRIARRKAEGAVAVEMECASVAAVCKSKKLNFGELLYVSDTVGGNDWTWRRYDKIALRTEIFKICFEALQLI